MTSRACLALGTVYIVWGSTYLGIALAGETIPPIFVAERHVPIGLASLLIASMPLWIVLMIVIRSEAGRVVEPFAE